MPSLRRAARIAVACTLLAVTTGGCGDATRTRTTSATTAVSPVASASGAASTGGSDGSAGRLLLVLDSSGSMAHPDDAGRTRMEGAQEALRSVVDDLPDDARVGLRVYGSQVQVAGKAAPGSPACTDSRLVVPVGALDRPAMKAAIDRFRPHGDTPIGYTLRQVAGDLGSSGPRAVVLVSDGEESCSADPCAEAKALTARGVKLAVHTVGLEVTNAAKSQLQCIADATGGTYHDATSADLTRTIRDTVASARKGPDWSVPGWSSGDANPGALGATVLIVLLLFLVTRGGDKKA